jgi:hypothetical protein
MAQNESANEGGSKNEGSSDSYESPSDTYPPCSKSQRSSGLQYEDYVPKQ